MPFLPAAGHPEGRFFTSLWLGEKSGYEVPPISPIPRRYLSGSVCRIGLGPAGQSALPCCLDDEPSIPSRLPSSKQLKCNVNLEYNMPERYLGIRVDCLRHAAVSIVERLHHVLENLGCLIVRGTFGHEVSVKSKKEHMHWHIEISKEGHAFAKHMSKQIKTAYDKQVAHEIATDPTLGVSDNHVIPSPLQHFSIKVLEECDDVNRFFRYPFKDVEEHEIYMMSSGFTDEELKVMWVQARTEREIALKIFEKHENKLNNEKQDRALLWEYLDDKFPHLELRLYKVNPDRSNDPCRLVASAIVAYNVEYNHFKVPMDLKRRTISYLAYRGMDPSIICDLLWK